MIARVEQWAVKPDVRWVSPRATGRPLTIFGGRDALAWYDILTFDRSRMDHEGIEKASQVVAEAVREERAKADRRVVLVGFSQGGILALHAGLRLRDEVAGIVALSAALPFPDRIPAADARSPRVFFGHGRFDSRVPHAMGRESYSCLKDRGYQVEWRSYWCGHDLTPRILRDVSGWLQRDDGLSFRLPAAKKARESSGLSWGTPARQA